MIKNDVIIGKDEWLFLYSGAHREFEHLLGEVVPSEESIKNFASNISSRIEFCNSIGTPYAHVVFPSKSIIMKQHLPKPYSEVESIFLKHYSKTSCYDRTPQLVYPDNELKILKKSFMHTDTHLSSSGAVEVAEVILERLGISISILKHLSEDIKNVRGDLSEMLKENRFKQEVFLYKDNDTTRTWDDSPYIKGNTNNITVMRNAGSVTNKRLLVFGDSFFKLSIKHYTHVFRDILYLRTPFFQKDVVELFAPDVVLSGNAERYLSHVKSDQESEGVLWSNLGSPQYAPNKYFIAALRSQLSFKHHPTTYKGWIDNKLKEPEIGDFRASYDISVLNKPECIFLCTGIDPQLTFEIDNLDPSSQYEFHITLTSDVEGSAELFFTTPNNNYFIQKNSARASVVIGDNNLVFPIPKKQNGTNFRFDPINRRGTVQVHSVGMQKLNSHLIKHDPHDLAIKPAWS